MTHAPLVALLRSLSLSLSHSSVVAPPGLLLSHQLPLPNLVARHFFFVFFSTSLCFLFILRTIFITFHSLSHLKSEQMARRARVHLGAALMELAAGFHRTRAAKSVFRVRARLT